MLTEKMMKKMMKFVQMSFKMVMFYMLMKMLYYLNNMGMFTELELQSLMMMMMVYLMYWSMWEVLSSMMMKLVTWEDFGGIMQSKWNKMEWKKKNKWGKSLVWMYHSMNMMAYMNYKYAMEMWKFMSWFNWKFYKYEKFSSKFWKMMMKMIKFMMSMNMLMYSMMNKMSNMKWTTMMMMSMWAFMMSLMMTMSMMNYMMNYFEMSSMNFYMMVMMMGMMLLFFMDDYMGMIKSGKFSIMKWYFADADMSMFLSASKNNNLMGTMIKDVMYNWSWKGWEPYMYGKNCVLKEMWFNMKFEEEWFMSEVKNKPSMSMHSTFVMNLNSFFKMDDMYVQYQMVLEYGKEKYKVKMWGKEEESEFSKEKCKKMMKSEKSMLKKMLFYLWDYESYQGHELTKAVEDMSDNGLMYVSLTLNLEKYKNTEKDQFDDWKMKEDMNEEHFFKDYNKLMYYASYKHSEDEHFMYEAHNDQFGDWGMMESFYPEETMSEETKKKSMEMKEMNKSLMKNCMEEMEGWQSEWEKEWEEGSSSYLFKN